MTAALNEDGTVPLKRPHRRRLQVILRVAGPECLEVVRDINPLWTAESYREMPDVRFGDDVDVQGEMARIMADELHRVLTPETLRAMLRELVSKVEQQPT